MTTLYIIRHARAARRGAHYPDDTKRPLVAKGFKQAAALAALLKKLGVTFDRLYSSPHTRAVQTAEPLAARLESGELSFLNELADDDYDSLLADLQGERIAIVGHEPFLSELTAYLLTGATDGVRVEVRKGAGLELKGTLAAGHMTLTALIPSRIYRHLQT